jgi:hypothetical protein
VSGSKRVNIKLSMVTLLFLNNGTIVRISNDDDDYDDYINGKKVPSNNDAIAM